MDDFFNNETHSGEGSNDYNASPKEQGNFSGEYHYVPPKNQGQYYTPGADHTPYSQPQQRYQNYYTPPVYQQNAQQTTAAEVESYVEGVPQKKKTGKKVLATILVILFICCVIAVVGLVSSAGGKLAGDSSDKAESTTQSQQADDAASASVQKSDEAAKTDDKGNLTAAGVAEEAMDSCVGITVYTQQNAYSYFYNYGQNSNGSGEQVASGEGSGVIMSEANGKTYIMT